MDCFSELINIPIKNHRVGKEKCSGSFSILKKLYHGKIYYGWYIVAASFVIMACTMGTVYNTASLFIKPIVADMGYSQSAVYFTLTLRSVTQLVISLFAAGIYRNYNQLKVMKLASVVMVIAFFSYSFASSLWMLYALTIIVSLSLSLISILPLSLILSNWFYEKTGTVIGIAFMGSGIGGMIFNSLAGQWIVRYGWRATYQILGVILTLAILPSVFLVLKIYPRNVGLKPYGEPLETGGAREPEKGFMLKEVLKRPKFWILLVVSVLFAVVMNTFTITIAPYLTDIGHSVTYAANMVALSMGVIAISKIVLGYLYDRLGLKAASIMASGAAVVGFIGLLNYSSIVMIVLLILGAGLSSAYSTIGPPIVTQKLFGKKDYSSIYCIIFAANSSGGAIAPLINGFTHDLTGSYELAIKMALFTAIAVTVVFLFLLPVKRNEIR